MKSKFSIIVIICLLLGGSANAQFFKKLKKKAEDAAERTILNRTDREVSKGTDKTIDNAMEGGDKDKKGTLSMLGGGGMDDLPASYEFQYIMDMKMTSGENEMLFTYYVQPTAGYFGFRMDMQNELAGNTFVVYDMENESMVSFIDTNGQKMAMRMNIPFDEEMQETIKNNGKNQSIEKSNITQIEGKTVLGYSCKGYQIKQEDGMSKFYITDEAPVSFIGMFASIKKMQKNMDTSDIPFDENSMMMEMVYIPNKKREETVHMICTAIKEQPYVISKADYKQM